MTKDTDQQIADAQADIVMADWMDDVVMEIFELSNRNDPEGLRNVIARQCERLLFVKDALRWRAMQSPGPIDVRIDGQLFIGITDINAWADARNAASSQQNVTAHEKKR